MAIHMTGKVDHINALSIYISVNLYSTVRILLDNLFLFVATLG